MLLPSLVVVGLILLIWFTCRQWLRRRRRNLHLNTLPPHHWASICQQHVRWFDRLTPADQQRLLQLARVFIDDKRFEPCGGLPEVTEEMRVIIATLACSLVLHRPPPHYPRLRSILIYPAGFDVPPDPEGFVRADPFQTTELMDAAPESLIGESWLHGSVVLAWDSIVHPPAPDRRDRESDNVALHEFAHQLDEQGPAGDGVPLLATRRDYESWQRVFSQAFDRLQARVQRGAPTALDPYAATDPAEFFAVATETFFERPETLLNAYPEVYQLLTDFYGFDFARQHA